MIWTLSSNIWIENRTNATRTGYSDLGFLAHPPLIRSLADLLNASAISVYLFLDTLLRLSTSCEPPAMRFNVPVLNVPTMLRVLLLLLTTVLTTKRANQFWNAGECQVALDWGVNGRPWKAKRKNPLTHYCRVVVSGN